MRTFLVACLFLLNATSGCQTSPPQAPLDTSSGGQSQVVSAASLMGKVKAPESLLGKAKIENIMPSGSSIISNNGASVVANNSGRYALLALTQAPYTGATVRLLSATGDPIRNAAGEPYVTVTDDAGAYAFPPGIPEGPLVVVVDLPEGRGTLQAFATAQGNGPRRAEVELVSSLTTGYVLERFIRPQRDPGAALSRLTPDAEAETRRRAEQALRENAWSPSRLNRQQVVGIIETLRAANTAFDEQMDAVKRLLIPAGQLDLGAGQPATSVRLKLRGPLALTPAGQLLMVDVPAFARLWQLSPAGMLMGFAGANRFEPNVAGRSALEAGLVPGVVSLQYDSQNRCLLADYGGMRLLRIEPDQTLSVLWDTVTQAPKTGMPRVLYAVWPGPSSREAWALCEVVDAPGRSLWHIREGQAPRRLAAVTLDANARLQHGLGPAGQLLLTVEDTLYQLDPQTGTLTPEWEPSQTNMRGLALAPTGEALALAADGTLWLRAPDGAQPVRLAVLPADTTWEQPSVAVAGQTVYFTQGEALLMKLHQGVLTRVAGTTETQSGDIRQLGFDWPQSLALAPGEGGNLLVADSFAGRLIEVEASGATWQRAKSDNPKRVRFAFDGTLWLLDATGLRRSAESSDLAPVNTDGLPAGVRVLDFALNAAGEVQAAVQEAQSIGLYKQAPGEAWQRLGDMPARNIYGMAIQADGRLMVTLQRPDDSLALMAREAPGGWTTWITLTDRSAWGAAVDAASRVYVVELHEQSMRSRVIRYAQAGAPAEIIAGLEGRIFSGDRVDTGLSADVGDIAFDAAGNLWLADTQAKQIKRVPAALLED